MKRLTAWLAGAGVLAALLLAVATGFAAPLPTTTFTSGEDWRSGTSSGLAQKATIAPQSSFGDLRLGGVLPSFASYTAWNTPSQGNSTYTAPVLADLNSDGLADLMIGKKDGSLVAYRNSGTLAGATWTLEATWAGPGQGANQYAAPALADLDDDGRIDLLVGRNDGTLVAYRNTGTTSVPAWTAADPSWNPPRLIGNTLHAAPAFGDIDGDGDYDLMIGDDSDLNFAYENTGSASVPTWTRRADWDGPHEASRGWTMLAFGDLNTDGHVDLLLGDSRGQITAYRHNGGSTSPWTPETSWSPPNGSQFAAPALANLDDDRDIDMLCGDKGGQVVGLRNNDAGSTASTGSWVSPAIDSGASGASWSSVSWVERAASSGAGSLVVEMRSAQTAGGLATASWAAVTNGAQALPHQTGRYAQIRVSFATASALGTQVLESLSVGPETDSTPPTTTQTGADDLWHGSDVVMTLAATDGGSGVARTEHSFNGSDWTTGASVTVPASADGSNDGEHTVWYRSVDHAGNVEPARQQVVKIVTQQPTTTVSGVGSDWSDSDVTLVFSSSSPGDPVVSYRIDGGEWIEGSSATVPAPPDGSNDGEHTVEYRSTDALGHVESVKSATVRIVTQPATTTVTGADDAWHDGDVTLDFSSGSPGDPAFEYRVDGGAWVGGSQLVIPASPDGSNDGEHTVEYRSTTALGHVEATKSVVVRIDAGAPTTSVSGADGAWHDADVTLAFSGSDAASGVAKTEYRIDGGAWVEGTEATIAAPSDGSGDGEHTVEYRSTDSAGHVETARSVVVKIDAGAPTTAVDGADEAWHETDVTLAFVGSDTGSGVAKVEYRLDGGAWVEGTSATVPAPPDGSNDGEHTVEYRSTDTFGHVETAKSVTVRIGRVDEGVTFVRHRRSLLSLAWPTVPGATTYEVRVDDGVVTTTTGTSLRLVLSEEYRGRAIVVGIVARDGAGNRLWHGPVAVPAP